eukprot:CAMPEP_0204392040 /NCGR_PEP_ID=MMETSP0469-20131031/61552_1 /ASSEMBLY_ACC=CAM_ASM_000384 /TAXON_ID=2969 /ORGANISM="Oxyrrhis marina" /LENGTH=567 /DNA_ID=CAMNT_0051386005 /DNA_START=68 /DNA_END=1769 /DNA_ORIENTATION=+
MKFTLILAILGACTQGATVKQNLRAVPAATGTSLSEANTTTNASAATGFAEYFPATLALASNVAPHLPAEVEDKVNVAVELVARNAMTGGITWPLSVLGAAAHALSQKEATPHQQPAVRTSALEAHSTGKVLPLDFDLPDDTDATLVPVSHTRGGDPLDEGDVMGTIADRGNPRVNREIMMRRLDFQDKCLLVMLLMVYLVTLALGWALVYRMSHNSAPIRFFSDPRYHLLTTEATDQAGFLGTFNQKPSGVWLQVCGFTECEATVANAVQWKGKKYVTDFNFALELSNWAESSGQIAGHDLVAVNSFLRTRNPLEVMVIDKQPAWEQLGPITERIKEKLAAQGYTGLVTVSLKGQDQVSIHQNDPWSNFMHNRTTKTLLALSIFGGALYVPYMWARCKKTVVKSTFPVALDPESYWVLIEDKIQARGFQAPALGSPVACGARYAASSPGACRRPATRPRPVLFRVISPGAVAWYGLWHLVHAWMACGARHAASSPLHERGSLDPLGAGAPRGSSGFLRLSFVNHRQVATAPCQNTVPQAQGFQAPGLGPGRAQATYLSVVWHLRGG